MAEAINPGEEVLRTERLILRRFRETDVVRYFEIYSHPLTAEGLGSTFPTITHAWRHMSYVEGSWPLRGYGAMCITEIGSEQMIGLCGPSTMEGAGDVEIGWTIDPALHGRGLATEAAIGAARWIFAEKPDLGRVVHYIEDRNLTSQAVARRIGGARTDETFPHPLAGPIPIWATARGALAGE
ncbi:MAG: GNAT family N-acetyltransferase [Pseudomonadota bacterium]